MTIEVSTDLPAPGAPLHHSRLEVVLDDHFRKSLHLHSQLPVRGHLVLNVSTLGFKKQDVLAGKNSGGCHKLLQWSSG